MDKRFYWKVIAFLLIAAAVLEGIGGIAEIHFIEILAILCICLAGVVFLVWLFKKFFMQ